MTASSSSDAAVPPRTKSPTPLASASSSETVAERMRNI
eukprot:CAMPEP_0117503820 /NCGR_PEP_ID=MMETSP0784-20121206/24532_1 /TAXON_ID=39447 /ORGANISM="" /LENGTH=37 /DNA_ID= /DNA_START= /DNA_END= /DNA_ORIENTATION=